jgi:hypothetical protein
LLPEHKDRFARGKDTTCAKNIPRTQSIERSMFIDNADAVRQIALAKQQFAG